MASPLLDELEAQLNGVAAAVESDSRSEAAPRHITDVVPWAINTVGAL
jgi:hypothetical protein